MASVGVLWRGVLFGCRFSGDVIGEEGLAGSAGWSPGSSWSQSQDGQHREEQTLVPLSSWFVTVVSAVGLT